MCMSSATFALNATLFVAAMLKFWRWVSTPKGKNAFRGDIAPVEACLHLNRLTWMKLSLLVFGHLEFGYLWTSQVCHTLIFLRVKHERRMVFCFKCGSMNVELKKFLLTMCKSKHWTSSDWKTMMCLITFFLFFKCLDHQKKKKNFDTLFLGQLQIFKTVSPLNWEVQQSDIWLVFTWNKQEYFSVAQPRLKIDVVLCWTHSTPETPGKIQFPLLHNLHAEGGWHKSSSQLTFRASRTMQHKASPISTACSIERSWESSAGVLVFALSS